MSIKALYKRALTVLKTVLHQFCEDILFIIGSLIISAGFYFIYKPLGAISLGGFFILAAYIIGKAGSDNVSEEKH